MFFLPNLEGGGTERVFVHLANGLVARGLAVHLVLANAVGPFLSELQPQVNVVNLGCGAVWRVIPSLVSALRRIQPCAVLAGISHANVTATIAHRLAGSRARLVLSEHAHLSSVVRLYPGLRMRVTRRLMRLTYPMAHTVVCVSEGVVADLRQHLSACDTRTVVVYNPVVDETLMAKASMEPAHPWLRQKDEPVVLAAGRLIAQKDFAMLLEAFALLRARRPARLLILGEGELRSALVAQAQRLGISDWVEMPGFEPNPFSAMRAAGLFVLSSCFEGLSCVLIEAMACGTRVVSTRCPSGPEEVLEDGRWGRLVPVGDTLSMAAAMDKALDDPHPPDVANRAAEFSVARAVQRYAEVLGVA